MAKDKQVEQVASALGLLSLGAGALYTLLPGTMGRLLGLKKESSEEGASLLAVRALGFRDLTFGLGLIINRKQPKIARQWLRLFALNMVGDVIACFTAFIRPGRNLVQAGGVLLSAVLGWWAWTTGQE